MRGGILYLVLIYYVFMKRITGVILLCLAGLTACKKNNTGPGENCPYVLYTPSGSGCAAGSVQVSGSDCCPENKPYSCNGVCFATCEEADKACSNSVIKGQVPPPGSAQLNGVWKRNTLSDPCEELTVFYDGTEGRVSAAANTCCYNAGELIWQKYAGDSIEVKACSQSFQNSLVVFNGNNAVTVGGIPYLRQ